jgi:hypothetical protein
MAAATERTPGPEPADDFEAHARDVLKDDPKLLSDLLALRADVRLLLYKKGPKPARGKI